MIVLNLPRREGEAPITAPQPPQFQFSNHSPRDIYKKFCTWFFGAFTHTREEPTRISVPSTHANTFLSAQNALGFEENSWHDLFISATNSRRCVQDHWWCGHWWCGVYQNWKTEIGLVIIREKKN